MFYCPALGENLLYQVHTTATYKAPVFEDIRNECLSKCSLKAKDMGPRPREVRSDLRYLYNV